MAGTPFKMKSSPAKLFGWHKEHQMESEKHGRAIMAKGLDLEERKRLNEHNQRAKGFTLYK